MRCPQPCQGETADEDGGVGASVTCDGVVSSRSNDVLFRVEPHHLQAGGGREGTNTTDSALQGMGVPSSEYVNTINWSYINFLRRETCIHTDVLVQRP